MVIWEIGLEGQSTLLLGSRLQIMLLVLLCLRYRSRTLLPCCKNDSVDLLKRLWDLAYVVGWLMLALDERGRLGLLSLVLLLRPH